MIRRLRLMYLERFLRLAPLPLKNLVALEHQYSPHTSWVASLSGDLECLRDTTPFLHHLPLPKDDWASWHQYILDMPSSFRSAVKKFNTPSDLIPQDALEAHLTLSEAPAQELTCDTCGRNFPVSMALRSSEFGGTAESDH